MIFLFNRKEELIGEIPRSVIPTAPIMEENLTSGLVQLFYSLKLDDKWRMDDVAYLGHRDVEEPDEIQYYKLFKTGNDDTLMHYTGILSAFDELKAYGYIRDKRPANVTAAGAAAVALEGSPWNLGPSDNTDLKSVQFYDNTRLECLTKIAETWGVEFSFHYTFSKNKITERTIQVHKKRGDITGKRFVYGTNALTVVKEEQHTEVYTAIAGRGKGESSYDEQGEATGGYGRKILFDQVAWSKAAGNPVDKPLGQDYVELPEMTALYGYPDGTPRIKIVTFPDIEDPAALLQASYEYLLTASRPLAQFASSIREMGRVQLGDTVGIIRKDIGIHYMTRIFKIRRNLWNAAESEIELGDNINYLHNQSRKNKDLQKGISEVSTALADIAQYTDERMQTYIERVQEEITNSYFNEDGYNYEFKTGNEYNLPAGYYSFNRPIDQNPTAVIYVGAGKMMIANSRDSNGNWRWRTFGTGDGFVADLIMAGMITGGNVRWNLETGTFLIGTSATNYQFYFDGQTLRINGKLIVNEINLTNDRIVGKNITLDGNVNVLGTFSVPGTSIFGTIDAQTINVTRLNADNLNRGTVGTSVSNTSGTFRDGWKDASFGGSATGVNGNSSTFFFDYPANRFVSMGRITARPEGNTHEFQLNGMYLSSSSGSAEMKVWSDHIKLSGTSPYQIDSGLRVLGDLVLRGQYLSLASDGTVRWKV